MDPRTMLFAEICAAAGIQTAEQREAVWSCLSHYAVQGTTAATSWADSVAAFVAAKQVDGLSGKTLHEYRRVLTAAGAALGDRPPSHVTTDHLRAYLAALTDGHKPGSVQTYANTLRSFFAWLRDEGQIERSPMAKIKSRRLDKLSTRKPLTALELEHVRQVCRTPRERALVELLASTGCRVGELCGIRREDIDTAAMAIKVHGKGNKSRIVLYTPRAQAALETYLAAKHPTGPLFPSVGAVQATLRRVGLRAGLSATLHPHRLRHTFATLAINRGMDLAVVQQLLGHSSPETTEIYAHLSRATIAQA